MTHFLVTAEKPDGHKLEDILAMIRKDILTRTLKIADDERPDRRQQRERHEEEEQRREQRADREGKLQAGERDLRRVDPFAG